MVGGEATFKAEWYWEIGNVVYLNVKGNDESSMDQTKYRGRGIKFLMLWVFNLFPPMSPGL